MLHIKENLSLLNNKDQLFDGYVKITSELNPEDRLMICVLEYDKGKEVKRIVFNNQTEGQVTFRLHDDLIRSKKLLLSVGVYNYNDYTFTNTVEVKLEPGMVAKVRRDEDEIKNLYFELFELKQQIADYKKNIGFEIPSFNKEYLKKGMMLSVIDDQGNVAFVNSYDDSIKEINGKKSFNYKLNLEAKDIPYQNLNIEDVLKNYSQAFKTLQNNYDNLVNTVEKIINQLKDLEVRFVEYTSRDII
jgi:tetratricopeptide (TPR) repeat protein